MKRVFYSILVGHAVLLAGCGDDDMPAVVVPDDYESTTDEPARPAIAADTLYNREAVIPPQCYTKTEGVNNPCYTCHQTYSDTKRPNSMADGFLQGDYNFSDLGVHNHWSNLFVDRRDEIAEISNDEIEDYVEEDNYSGFIERLQEDENWSGPVPAIEDLAEGAAAFDDYGLARDGSGWVAFNYKPLPSTFWPTNGSTDDVIIRLPEAFRMASCGDDANEFSRDVYFTNLALLEMAMKDLSNISTPPIDENSVCADLNSDGVLSEVTSIAARPKYVGAASGQKVEQMSYPEGTQFIHTVRYIGFDGDDIVPSKRMKEVRYMKKVKHYSVAELASLYGNERQEKIDGNLPVYSDHGDKGLNNGMGWEVLGFIEDGDGELRKQTYQEQMFCMGCHGTIGTTVDQTFAFPRKVTGAGGWGYIDLKGMIDAPNRGEKKGEILQYLERVGGGNEFRENPEMNARWFNEDGSVKTAEVVAADVYTLITPSRERALALNKAYKVIVDEQSFVYGRDATVVPAKNVFRDVDPEKAPPLEAGSRVNHWDIRLDW
ncbi:hypothetical protein SAMN04487881_1607 [Marinobacter sp. es.048]|uniref:hypothetical protein n=1 Tax=Marinobacter sp. es.048 TaxID=1761795 RepID=UPI000B58C42B|nr:hypothetical protein [Marinobacter sp. es.048]SNC66438.1 hypothetical protein SAMN04487881_1607 [Marinobacter sp. es.048]